LRLPFGRSKLDDDVLAFHVAQLAEALPKCGDELSRGYQGIQPENPNVRHLRRLLRLGGKRRGEEHRTRTSKEHATVHHCSLPLS